MKDYTLEGGRDIRTSLLTCYSVFQLRQQRKDDLEKHVAEVNRLVRQANGDLSPDLSNDSSEESSDNDDDDDSNDNPAINDETSYTDDAKHTTVTIESVTIDRTGFSRPGDIDEEAQLKKKKAEEEQEQQQAKKRVWTKAFPKSDKPRVRKKKFRYETKVERKQERVKQALKKKKQAAARKKE